MKRSYLDRSLPELEFLRSYGAFRIFRVIVSAAW
jgi:hypothetical protein